jgi:hypothetical protein
LNLVLFLIIHLTFIRLNPSMSNFLCCPLIYQTCSHNIVVIIMVSSHAGSYIGCGVINLAVKCPIRRSPGVYMNVLMRKNCAVNSQVLFCCRIYYFSTVIITVLMSTLIPSCQFENTFCQQFCFKVT